MNLIQAAKRHWKPSRGEAVFLLIVGFLMGSIFLLNALLVGMTVNGRTVLDFDRVQEIARRESVGFTVFGLFAYAIALFAAVSLMKGRKQ